VSPEALAKRDYLFLFALKLQSFGWRATFFPLEYVGMQRPSRAKGVPRSLGEGGSLGVRPSQPKRPVRRSRRRDYHEICLSSPKPFRPNSTLCRRHHQPSGTPPGTQRWCFFAHIQIPPLEGCCVFMLSRRPASHGV